LCGKVAALNQAGEIKLKLEDASISLDFKILYMITKAPFIHSHKRDGDIFEFSTNEKPDMIYQAEPKKGKVYINIKGYSYKEEMDLNSQDLGSMATIRRMNNFREILDRVYFFTFES
jgi:hypothetical protein